MTAAPTDRWTRILLQIVGDDGADQTSARLCEGAARATRVDGAGVRLIVGDVTAAQGCASDDVAASIEDLQFVLGEGPCVEAHEQSAPVLVPDLCELAASRWPAFTPAAIATGARAVFGFPLRVGAIRLGAIDLYRVEPGPLSDDQHADALVAADIVARALLTMQANAPSGTVAAEIEAGGDLRHVVHQAAGMVAAQLDVSVGQALMRLRASAFASGRPIAEVAGDVIGRRLQFDEPHDGPHPSP